MLWVAEASFLDEEIRVAMWERASGREVQGAAWARKVDFWMVRGAEVVHLGDGYSLRMSCGEEDVRVEDSWFEVGDIDVVVGCANLCGSLGFSSLATGGVVVCAP